MNKYVLVFCLEKKMLFQIDKLQIPSEQYEQLTALWVELVLLVLLVALAVELPLPSEHLAQP